MLVRFDFLYKTINGKDKAFTYCMVFFNETPQAKNHSFNKFIKDISCNGNRDIKTGVKVLLNKIEKLTAKDLIILGELNNEEESNLIDILEISEGAPENSWVKVTIES